MFTINTFHSRARKKKIQQKKLEIFLIFKHKLNKFNDNRQNKSKILIKLKLHEEGLLTFKMNVHLN